MASSRRALIEMDDREVAAFLARERTVICATLGPRGWPHLMPLSYVLREAAPEQRGPQIWAWTYAASQKARNLDRDPRATLQVEAGESYEDLRGVMLETHVAVHADTATVASLGLEITRRCEAPLGEAPLAALAPEVEARVIGQAPKRIALQFVEMRRVTWDHGKLGGVY